MASKAVLRARLSASLNHTARSYRRRMDEALAPLGLSEAMAVPLITISRVGEGIRQNALADMLRLEPASLVRVLDHLCAAGFLERRNDTTDRRANGLHLTKAGRAVSARVELIFAKLRDQVLGGISQADLEACLRVFAAIDASVNTLPIASMMADEPV